MEIPHLASSHPEFQQSEKSPPIIYLFAIINGDQPNLITLLITMSLISDDVILI
jgi:hypothetical protein